MNVMQLDLRQLRIELTRMREVGTPWRRAWDIATAGVEPVNGEGQIFAFMHRHFEAAYLNNAAPHGRCGLPPRDVSSAVALQFAGMSSRDTEIVQAVHSGQTQSEVAQAQGLTRARVSQIVQAVEYKAPDRDRAFCRSGDGCDRPATRGRFGKTFCERHGAELEALAAKLKIELAEADPRNKQTPQAA